uniref:Uncharacterized protein n=1 Tax=Arundo donax TaxID=35708 RepID=A0A0A9DRJ2_ARUDO
MNSLLSLVTVPPLETSRSAGPRGDEPREEPSRGRRILRRGAADERCPWILAWRAATGAAAAERRRDVGRRPGGFAGSVVRPLDRGFAGGLQYAAARSTSWSRSVGDLPQVYAARCGGGGAVRALLVQCWWCCWSVAIVLRFYVKPRVLLVQPAVT